MPNLIGNPLKKKKNPLKDHLYLFNTKIVIFWVIIIKKIKVS